MNSLVIGRPRRRRWPWVSAAALLLAALLLLGAGLALWANGHPLDPVVFGDGALVFGDEGWHGEGHAWTLADLPGLALALTVGGAALVLGLLVAVLAVVAVPVGIVLFLALALGLGLLCAALGLAAAVAAVVATVGLVLGGLLLPLWLPLLVLWLLWLALRRRPAAPAPPGTTAR